MNATEEKLVDEEVKAESVEMIPSLETFFTDSSDTADINEAETAAAHDAGSAEAEAVQHKAIPEKAQNEKKSAPQTQKTRAPRYINRASLTGTIVKLVGGGKTAIVTLCTKATMTVSNYPTVFFFGELSEKAMRFKEGDRVHIEGNLQSYDKDRLKKGQSPYLLVGQRIDYDMPTEAKEDEPDLKPIESVCHSDLNEIEIRGEIMAIQRDKGNDITLTIRTFVGKRVSIIDCPYYARNAKQFLPNIHVSQFIRAIGTVQTANIPVEPSEEEATELSVNGKIRRADGRVPRIRTRKKQYYILYDVYNVDPGSATHG